MRAMSWTCDGCRDPGKLGKASRKAMDALAFQALVAIAVIFVSVIPDGSAAFSTYPARIKRSRFQLSSASNNEDVECSTEASSNFATPTRRMAFAQAAATTIAGFSCAESAQGAVGTLREFSKTNAVLQGITINVADKSQQDAMISFLQEGFGFEVLRQIKAGGNSDTWLGFGPEQLSIPSDFTLPVSSFAKYGGHAAVHIRYDAQATDVYYKKGEAAPGDNIAFLQVGVPAYRISKMVQNGGNIVDAFGIVNVVSPCGLPMRGIVGISPDPIMFIALNCDDVQTSRDFYGQLGFTEQEYPYSRPSKGTGQFEPPQPPKSVYMAPSPNCMGILLMEKEGKKKKIKPNMVVRSLNVVYTPSEGAEVSGDETTVVDPSGVSIAFQSVGQFESEQRASKK